MFIGYVKPCSRADLLPLLRLQKLSVTLPDRVPENTESLVKSALSPLAEVGSHSACVTDESFSDAAMQIKLKQLNNKVLMCKS